MEEIQIDFQKVLDKYNAKMSEMMSRIIVLEVENQTLREMIQGQEDKELLAAFE